MASGNAISSIRFELNDRKLWIQFVLEEHAKILGSRTQWTLDKCSAKRSLPDSVLYTFTSQSVFGLGFKDDKSAKEWSKTSIPKLWEIPEKSYGAANPKAERCIRLFWKPDALSHRLGRPSAHYTSPRESPKVKKERLPTRTPREKVKKALNDVSNLFEVGAKKMGSSKREDKVEVSRHATDDAIRNHD